MSNETEKELTIEKIKLDADVLEEHQKNLPLVAFVLFGQVKFLLSKLATIERDTAEKCAEIAEETIEHETEYSCVFGSEAANEIRINFSLDK